MRNALAPVATLLVGVSILLTGLGLQGTLLPVRASLEAFSTFSIGVMGAAYFLGFTLGCLKGGELVKNVGHVRVFLAMTALGSAAPLIHGMVLNPVAWSLLRFLTGFCFAVLFVVIESWLNERSSNEDRGIVFSTYVMITLTVMAAGQMMTLLYDPSGLQLFVIASVLVSLGAVPVALSKSQTPEQPQEVEVDLRRLFRISPAGTVGCFAHGVANGAFWALAPVFTAGDGDDAVVRLFKTSDEPECCSLAATAGPQQCQYLTAGDAEVKSINRSYATEMLGQADALQRRTGWLPISGLFQLRMFQARQFHREP